VSEVAFAPGGEVTSVLCKVKPAVHDELVLKALEELGLKAR
jgi:hypothetical protein